MTIRYTLLKANVELMTQFNIQQTEDFALQQQIITKELKKFILFS